MTREAQMRDAIKLLRPTAQNRAAYEKWIAIALDNVAIDKDRTQFDRDTISKQAKKSLETYRAALRRAQTAHQKLPKGLKDKLESTGKVEILLKGLAYRDGAALPDYATLIRACDRAAKVTVQPSRSDFEKFYAAVWAYNVLTGLGRQALVTKKGTWAKLAAILHGAPDADLYYHCRLANISFKPSETNSGFKTVPT